MLANTPTLIEAQLSHFTSPMSNGMIFTQADSQDWFILDNSQTYASPDPPKTGAVVNFTLGGLWITDASLDHINFQCHLFGALVYNEDFPNDADLSAGGWSYEVPFDVPSVAPATTYYISVFGYGENDERLFQIDTNFKFA